MTNLKKLNQDIFTVSLITFILLFFIELLSPKFVIAYIDLNKILLITLITGSLYIYNNEENKAGDKESLKLSVIIGFSIITFLFILALANSLNFISILLAVVGGLVTFTLGKTLNN